MPRIIRTVAATGALLLALSACGGDGDDSTTPTLPTLNDEESNAADATSTTTTEAPDPEEAFREYTACMREQGVDMPDPEVAGDGGVITIEGDGGMDFDAFEEAAVACDPILESAFGEFELSPEEEAEMMDQELAMAQCMRDNGVDWPDPASGGSQMIELGDDVDPEAIEAAMETCSKDFLGEGGGFTVSEVSP